MQRAPDRLGPGCRAGGLWAGGGGVELARCSREGRARSRHLRFTTDSPDGRSRFNCATDCIPSELRESRLKTGEGLKLGPPFRLSEAFPKAYDEGGPGNGCPGDCSNGLAEGAILRFLGRTPVPPVSLHKVIRSG